MPGNHHLAMLFWAAREVLRMPGRSVLLFICLSSLVFLMSTPLLFGRALDETWMRLVKGAPDLVIRRIDAGGWAPLPSDESVSLAGTVPGALDPVARLWGVATGPDGPLTVVASAGVLSEDATNGIKPPSAGQAIVGQLIKRSVSGTQLKLVSRHQIEVEVVGSFPPDTHLVTSDVVWIAEEDARQLLGLSPNQASDIAIRLFRKEEETAIQKDLAAAFPWPVRITDRSTSALRHHSLATKAGGVGVLLAVPALLAMLFLITEVIVGSRRRFSFWVLLQSMGWTTGDLVRVELAKAVIVGAPAIVSGLTLAHAFVFSTRLAGITAYLISGRRKLPALTLDATGALLVMIYVTVLVGLPYLAAVFLTSLRATSGDPQRLIGSDSWS
jgi:hypothetical protein